MIEAGGELRKTIIMMHVPLNRENDKIEYELVLHNHVCRLEKWVNDRFFTVVAEFPGYMWYADLYSVLMQTVVFDLATAIKNSVNVKAEDG